MKFKSQRYKLSKLKNYINNEKKIIICNIINLNSYKYKNLEKELKLLNIKYYKISNKLILNSFKNSIFKNLVSLINGPIIFINKFNINIKLSFICIKLNNKIYSKKEFNNINKINYNKIFYNLNKKLVIVLKNSLNKLIL